MTPQESFRAFVEANEPVFRAWGSLVASEVCDGICRSGVANVDHFLKVPATPRIKTVKSALGKLLRKPYAQPEREMTDLVGVRFVVLLKEEIDTVRSVIKENPKWTAVLARDPAIDIEHKPEHFDYQSVHFDVRAAHDLSHGTVTVPAGTCCEVQVRTLLQHAYAEVVHDSIYKAVGVVPAAARRLVSRSMALMETTDEQFSKTMDILHESNAGRNEALAALDRLYRDRVGTPLTDERSNLLFIETFSSDIPTDLAHSLDAFLDSKPYIVDRVRDHARSDTFFAQPIALLAYFLASRRSDTTHRQWPLGGARDSAETVFSDLSIYPHG